jgi:hypothetical protein
VYCRARLQGCSQDRSLGGVQLFRRHRPCIGQSTFQPGWPAAAETAEAPVHYPGSFSSATRDSIRRKVLWMIYISGMAKTAVNQDPPAPFARWLRFHSFLGPPQQPSAQDLAFCRDIAGGWIRERGAPRLLFLGVTPDFYSLPWPEGTGLLAVDVSQAMIDNVWPGKKDTALCADWLSMDLPPGSRDIALCDGGLPMLDYPQAQHGFVRILHRVLSDEGLCIFRMFVLPEKRETPDVVLQDFVDGKIGNLSSLVLRMNMALQRSADEGIVFGKVHEAIWSVPHLDGLLVRLGWSPDHLTVIDDCRAITSQWHVLTLQETIDLFCRDPGGFRVQEVRTPSYDLGERCLTVALAKIP